MLASLEKRAGKQAGSTVVVDRGMAHDENLEEIRAPGHPYLVASRQQERNSWLAEFENEDDWEEVLRTPSPRNPAQNKSQVRIKRQQKGEEAFILCLREGREAKDRTIREKQEQRLLADLEALKTRIEKGHLKNPREDLRSDRAAQGALSTRGALLPEGVSGRVEQLLQAAGSRQESNCRKTRQRICAQGRSPGSER
jgi:hypothetical protein